MCHGGVIDVLRGKFISAPKKQCRSGLEGSPLRMRAVGHLYWSTCDVLRLFVLSPKLAEIFLKMANIARLSRC